MKYVSSGLLLLTMATAFSAIGAPWARAQFYHLDGRFECLNRPGALCYDATVAAAPVKLENDARPASAEQKTAPPATISNAAVSNLNASQEPLAQQNTEPPTHLADPLQAIAARIGTEAPTPADFALLEAGARSGNVKAIELLAWCAYAGIGGKPDPVRAYFLYGQGAAYGVPAMARNQATLYANVLTSEQRQQIAEIENGR